MDTFDPVAALDSERYLIGMGIGLGDTEVFDDAALWLTEECFADSRNRTIFGMITEMRAEDAQTSVEAVIGRLEGAGLLKGAGGEDYVRAIGMPHDPEVLALHVDIVRSRAEYRQLASESVQGGEAVTLMTSQLATVRQVGELTLTETGRFTLESGDMLWVSFPSTTDAMELDEIRRDLEERLGGVGLIFVPAGFEPIAVHATATA